MLLVIGGFFTSDLGCTGLVLLGYVEEVIIGLYVLGLFGIFWYIIYNEVYLVNFCRVGITGNI